MVADRMKATTQQSVRRLFADTEKLMAEIEQAESGLRALRKRLRQRLWFLSTLQPDALRVADQARMARLLDGTAKAKTVIESIVKRQRGRFTAASIVTEVKRSHPAVARRMSPATVSITLTRLNQLGVLKHISTTGRTHNYTLKH